MLMTTVHYRKHSAWKVEMGSEDFTALRVAVVVVVVVWIMTPCSPVSCTNY